MPKQQGQRVNVTSKRQLRVIRPLDDEGLDFSRPSTEAKYANLKGVFRQGRFRKRPAHVLLGTVSVASGVAVANPVAIVEFQHAVTTEVSETIRPDADGNYTTWTRNTGANDWQAVDEATPDDDTTYLESSTLGDKSSVGFANPGSTFVSVAEIVFRIRAKQDSNADYTMDFWIRVSSTDHVLGSTVVEKGTAYVEITITAELNPADSAAWAQADLDALELVWAIQSEAATVEEFISPNAEGQDTGWAANAHLLVDDPPAGLDDKGVWDGTTGLTTTSDNDTTKIGKGASDAQRFISFLFSNLQNDFVSISRLRFIAHQRKSASTGNTTSRWFFYNAANTARVVLESGMEPSASVWGDRASAQATNPETTNIWTESEVDAIEMGIEITGGTLRTIEVSQVMIGVTGVLATTSRVTQISATINGITSSGRDKSKLFITSQGFLRIDEDLTGSTDVSGAVTASTAPSTRHWDYCTLLGEMWFVNGSDDTYRYPNASNVFIELAAQPIGHTCASFARRLLLGNVLESGTRSPDRVRYSKFEDATDWSDATAGDLDLQDTPGAIVKLLPMGSGACIAYKEMGIYNLTRSGDSAAPFLPFLRNPGVGCLSMASVVDVVTPHGIPAHVFLGKGKMGLNIFTYDGSLTVPIGTPISDEIERLSSKSQLERTFSIVDPVNQQLLIFIPESSEVFPTNMWVYDLRSLVWSKPSVVEVTAAGIYSISDTQTVVLGRNDSLPYQVDPSAVNDEGTSPIDQVWETSDWHPAGEPEKYITVYATWVTFYDRGAVDISISHSTDGGITFSSQTTIRSLTTLNNDGSLQHVQIPHTPVNGRRIRTRISASAAGQELDLIEVMLEYMTRDLIP